jgi:hypothetical protein
MGRQPPIRERIFHYRVWMNLEVAILIVGVLLIFVTLDIGRRDIFPFVTDQVDYIVAAESALVGILLIEVIGRIIVSQFRERGVLAYGFYVRTVIRIVGYLIIVVSIISILAANPALAISIGTILV